LIAIATRLLDIRLVRYLLASVVALGADIGSFLVMYSFGTFVPAAYAASYSVGILIHWLISSRLVFSDTVAQRGRARTRQKAMFVGSALMGLGVTTVIGSFAVYAGIHPIGGKAAAVVASFTLTWVLRSRLIFREKTVAALG